MEKIYKCIRCKKRKEYKSTRLCNNCVHKKFEETDISDKKRKRLQSREYYLLNKDKEDYRIKKKIFYKKWNKNKRKEDTNFAMTMRIRNYFYYTLKKYTTRGKITNSYKYGIDYKAIIEHLKPFPEDISKYHIDHIKPLCSFNLEDKEEIKKAFAPENHQWLLAEDNLKKIRKDKLLSLKSLRKI
jgi:hypothetical protein